MAEWSNAPDLKSGVRKHRGFESLPLRIEQANQGLNRIKIFRRDRKLALRGSLPKKPGKGQGNRQTTIALGIFANPSGVKVALAKAQRLESDLNMDRFQWADWEGGSGEQVDKTAADWAKEFGAIKAGTIQASSYESNYRDPLGSLPNQPLTEALLIAHILGRRQQILSGFGLPNALPQLRQGFIGTLAPALAALTAPICLLLDLESDRRPIGMVQGTRDSPQWATPGATSRYGQTRP